MSAEGVRLAINKIADELLSLSALVLEDDSVGTNVKIGRNTLRDSALHGDLEGTVTTFNGGDPVITALFNNYIVYLEWDRPKRYKKPPPIDALKDWAASNGIPTDAETLYKISTAIWRDGHKGRPIFATIDRELDGLFEDDWSDKLMASIFDNLDLFFNN